MKDLKKVYVDDLVKSFKMYEDDREHLKIAYLKSLGRILPTAAPLPTKLLMSKL